MNEPTAHPALAPLEALADGYGHAGAIDVANSITSAIAEARAVLGEVSECQHRNVRTFRSLTGPHSKCLDCYQPVAREWVRVDPVTTTTHVTDWTEVEA